MKTWIIDEQSLEKNNLTFAAPRKKKVWITFFLYASIISSGFQVAREKKM